MFNKYYKLISFLARKWIFYLLLSLILTFNFFIFPGFFKGNPVPPDVKIFYTANYLKSYVNNLDQISKTREILFHWTLDLIYPIIYTIFLSIIFIFLNRSKSKKLIVYFPLSVFIFDIAENVLLSIIMIKNTAQIFFKVTPIITLAKWFFLLINVFLMLFLLMKSTILKSNGKN